MKRRRQRGLTLVELIVAFTIMMLLTTMAVPLARYKVQRDKERDLDYALREIRTAIDKFKDDMDAGKIGPAKLDTDNYPESLQQLVDGIKATGAVDKKIKYLRRIPKDPMTNSVRVGNAQHARRSDVAVLGRPERIRRVHQEHGQGARWNSVFPMVSAVRQARPR